MESARLSDLSDHSQDVSYCAAAGELEECSLAMHAADSPLFEAPPCILEDVGSDEVECALCQEDGDDAAISERIEVASSRTVCEADRLPSCGSCSDSVCNVIAAQPPKLDHVASLELRLVQIVATSAPKRLRQGLPPLSQGQIPCGLAGS